MLLVLSEEHKEHLGFLTKVDIEGERRKLMKLQNVSKVYGYS